MHWLVIFVLLGCTATPEPPAPEKPLWNTGSVLEGWEVMDQARPAQVQTTPEGMTIQPQPGGPSWGTKVVKTFGVTPTESLAYLLVHFSQTKGAVRINWRLSPWQGKGLSDIVLGAASSEPQLFSLTPQSAPSGQQQHEIGIRVGRGGAQLQHLEWIQRPLKQEPTLIAEPCRYLVFDLPEGQWEIEWGGQTRKGTRATTGAWNRPAAAPAPAKLKGVTPHLFQWAGCQPVAPFPTNEETP